MLKRDKLIRGLRKKAETLGVDVSGLTDDELEHQLVDNSKALASTIAAGVGGAAKKAASRVAALREALSEWQEKDQQ
jgi:hypothetical protein